MNRDWGGGTAGIQQQNNLNNFGWSQSVFYNEPQILQQPANAAANAGESVSFTVSGNLRGKLGAPSTTNGGLNFYWQSCVADATQPSGIRCATIQQPDLNLIVGGVNGATLTINSVSATMNGMMYRAAAWNGAGEDVSQPATLTVLSASASPVSTLQATNTTSSGATLNGSVNPNGTTTTAYFDYGLSAGSLTSIATYGSVGSGIINIPVSWAISGLTCNATYYFRARAVNNTSSTNGQTLSFTTSACQQATVPTVATSSATNVTSNSAVLNGTITSDGGSTILERRFDWGTSYTPNVTVSGTNFSYLLTGLSANTTYQYRAWARNSAGWSVPVPQSFTTGSSTAPVNGVCGPANGSVVTAAPTTNLCNSGTASQVTGSGPWSWSCVGSNGGATANCSATPGTPTVYNISVTASPAAGGGVSGGGSWGAGTTATVTASANSGYRFVNWTENGIAVSSSATYSFAVSASRNLVANFDTALLVPGNPSPANGAVGLPRVNSTFSWTGGGSNGTVEYAFFIDTNPNPGIYIGWGSTTGSSAQVAYTLQPAMTYYWKVKARDSSGAITESPVWQFTTEYSNPDLVVSNVVLNGNVAPDASVTADVTVQNIGNFPSSAGVYTRLYLSRAPGAKESSLTPYVSYSVPELQPNATHTFSIPVTLNGLQAGQSYIDAWVDSSFVGAIGDSNVNNNIRSIPISYVDGVKPNVTYISLQNSFVKTGVANNIVISAADDVGVKTLDFYYSVDAGATWAVIQEGYVPAAQVKYGISIPWTIPANLPVGANLQVKAVARDTSGNWGEGIAGPYTVRDGTVPGVTLLSPNGGEILDLGSTQTIKWNANVPNGISRMDLYLYYGNTATHIADIKSNTTGSYTWTVPSYSSYVTSTAKIKISVDDLNGNHNEDWSDNSFTIRDAAAPPPAPWTTPSIITSVPSTKWPYTSKSNSKPVVVTDKFGIVHMVYTYVQDDMSGLVNNTFPARVITQQILYKKLVNGTWSAPTLVYSVIQNTNSGMAGYYGLVNVRLAVDNNGYPHIVWGTDYSTPSDWGKSDIFYSFFNGTSWLAPQNISSEILDGTGLAGAMSGSPVIGIDSANKVHVVWADGDYMVPDATAFIGFTHAGVKNIYHKVKDAVGWSSFTQITTTGGSYPAMTVDQADTVHIVFPRWNGSYTNIGYAKWTVGSWSAPTIIDEPMEAYIDLASDSAGHLHMAWRYYDAAAQSARIRYSAFDGAAWSPYEAVSGTGQNAQIYPPSVVVDSLDRPHIVWPEMGSNYANKLLYSMKLNGQWLNPVQLNNNSQNPDYADAALSPLNNEMHVVWVAGYNGNPEVFYNHANVGYVTDIFPPSVSVSAPFAGANLSMGVATAIQWSANDNVGVTAVDLHYSKDNGATWILIAANQPNTGTYSWVVPAATSMQIRVTARDAAGNAGTGFSVTATTADVTPPTIALTSPTSGTLLAGNSTVNVNWAATDNIAVTSIDLDYSLDSGTTWLQIAGGVANNGNYLWQVPNVATSTLLVRATAHDGVGFASAAISQAITVVRENSAPFAPSMPFPLADSISVPNASPVLQWSSGDADGDALTYQILFGTSPTPPVVATVTGTSYSVGTLHPTTRYYWQIIASDGRSTTASPVWSFTTASLQLSFTDSITGFVRDSTGVGLPNVSVRAYTGTGWSGGETFADTVTQPDGRYTLPLPKGTYTVGITTNMGCPINPCPPAYGSAINNVVVNGQQVLDFAVPQLVTLSGRVTDANNIGVAGASLNLQNLVTVDLMMWFYPYIQPVQTGADGSYSIQVYPGSYNIGITNGSTSYLVAAGANIAADGVRDFVLNAATPAMLSGFVRDSANQGVGGVTVYVNTGVNWYGMIGSTTSAPDGSYQLPLPQDGTYTVGITTVCAQWPCPTYAKADSVTVTGNTVHDFTLPPLVTLSGVVSNAGVGVPNASVNVWTPYDAGMMGYGSSYGYVSTAADGSYSLSVYAGSYDINVSLPNGTIYSDNFMVAANLNVAADTVQNFAVDGPNSISGFVRDASGLGMGGIAIGASSRSGIYGSTATAADGSYRIPLPPGTYTLQVGNIYYCSPACPAGPVYQALLNNVSVNGAVTHDFVASPVVTLSGKVVDVNGTPVAGIGVNAVSPAQRGMYMYALPTTMVNTDQNGNYSIPVYAGKYDIEVGVPSLNGGGLGTRYTSAANVAIATDTIRDLTLFNIYTPQNRISGRLIGSNVAVWYYAALDLNGPDFAFTYPDWLGNYSFSDLADGTYTLTPSMRGYSFGPATRSITIAGASVNGVDFRICREGSSLTGVVLDTATRIALPSGSILVDGVPYSVDATGHYSIPGLSCGTHNVAVNVSGYVSYSAALDTYSSWNLEIGLTKVALTAPSAPTIGTALAGNTQATVSFAAPANNGGSAITGYTVTSTPGNVTASGTASAIVVTGLTNGTAYTFTVTATNSAGTSLPSAASNAVTPSVTYTVSTSAGANGSISPVSQTVTQGNTASFTITPYTGYTASASGCGGSLAGSTYTTGLITANCTVSITFALPVLANLVPGWNLIGNGVDAPLDVAVAFGDATKVTSVWKWIQSTSKWAFYAPSMTAPNLATFAAGKGFDVLATINGGEGFWVSAKQPFTVLQPVGTTINAAYFQEQIDPALNKLGKGWNLIGTGEITTPSAFNIGLSVIPPPAGTIPQNVTTLWVWDNAQSNWYFYAPSLEAKGGTALTDYITGKGYLDFTANGKMLGQGVGFWLNRP